MNVLGAYVPVSYWTVVSLVAGITVSLLVWRPLAGRVGWRPPYTLVALLAVTLTLSLTLPPGAEEWQPGLRACFADGATALADAVQDVGATAGSVLNVVLLLPVGFGVAAASRKAWPGVIISVLLPIAIEVTQTAITGRRCDSADMVANVVGGLLGVLVAAAFVRHRRPGTRR